MIFGEIAFSAGVTVCVVFLLRRRHRRLQRITMRNQGRLDAERFLKRDPSPAQIIAAWETCSEEWCALMFFDPEDQYLQGFKFTIKSAYEKVTSVDHR